MKGIPKASAETSLSFLAYNFKRAINILGVPKMIEALG
jgi:transposase